MKSPCSAVFFFNINACVLVEHLLKGKMQFSIEQKGVICAIEAHKLRLAQRQNVIYGAMLQNFSRFYWEYRWSYDA